MRAKIHPLLGAGLVPQAEGPGGKINIAVCSDKQDRDFSIAV